jgi:predicted RNA-binding Zn-ribbon protein involved in translation (DUF1610 family)
MNGKRFLPLECPKCGAEGEAREHTINGPEEDALMKIMGVPPDPNFPITVKLLSCPNCGLREVTRL